MQGLSSHFNEFEMQVSFFHLFLCLLQEKKLRNLSLYVGPSIPDCRLQLMAEFGEKGKKTCY